MADAVKNLIAEIHKAYGSESLMRMSGRSIEPVPVIGSGSLSLDAAMGVGGYPRGRIVEIFGPEASGKTTLALHAIAEAQAEGGVAAFVDAEHALDIKYAENLGVNVDDLLLSQPDYGEQALGIVEKMAGSSAIDIVVIDSVAALTPKDEIDGEMGDPQMGKHARLMSQAMRKLTAIASKSMTTLVFINQLRHKIGIIYGSPEVTTGGDALKYYASMRLDVRRRKQIKEGGKDSDDVAPVGNHTEVKVVKNKLAPPFRQVELEIIWGKGINKIGDLLSCAIEHKIVDKNGSWYMYEGQRIAQGYVNAIDSLKRHPKTMGIIEAKVRKLVMP